MECFQFVAPTAGADGTLRLFPFGALVTLVLLLGLLGVCLGARKSWSQVRDPLLLEPSNSWGVNRTYGGHVAGLFCNTLLWGIEGFLFAWCKQASGTLACRQLVPGETKW